MITEKQEKQFRNKCKFWAQRGYLKPVSKMTTNGRVKNIHFYDKEYEMEIQKYERLHNSALCDIGQTIQMATHNKLKDITISCGAPKDHIDQTDSMEVYRTTPEDLMRLFNDLPEFDDCQSILGSAFVRLAQYLKIA